MIKYFEENKKIVEQRFEQTKQQIKYEFMKNKVAIIENFCKAFNEVFQKGLDMQSRGEKNAIVYVCISLLRTSLIAKTFDVRLDLYDKNLYLDQKECEGYWKVDFIYQYLSQDQAYFANHVRNKIIRLQNEEIEMFMKQYHVGYFHIIEEFCLKNINKVIQLNTWNKLHKESQIKFTYGEFLDKGIFLEVGGE